jgi:hypothetical protein
VTDDLTALLHDAVADVEPADRLGAIRQQTQRRARTRWYAVGGAVLATAAVVTGMAIVARPSPDPGPGPTAHPSIANTPTPSTHAVAVYYLGHTPVGPRLFREFHQRTGPASLDEALGELSKKPDDPDYTTLWVPGGLAPATVRDGVIVVEVVGPAVHDRRPGMTPTEAELSVQQVVYTVQGAVGARLPVQFVSDGQPVDQVYGVPTSEPLANAPELDVLALVSISNPSEGRAVEGSFSADGVASSFEGTVPWELRDAAGTVVKDGSAQGTMEDHLTPWETGAIDVSGLPPGTYTFAASTDDPTGGTEGPGPTTDTRTIVVQ